MSTKTDFLPEKVRKEVEEFVDRLTADLEDEILEVIIFGSSVRGELHEESDIDILCVVTDRNLKLFTQITGMAYEVFLHHGRLLSVKVFSKRDFDRLVGLNTAFVRNVLSEGEVLWRKN